MGWKSSGVLESLILVVVSGIIRLGHGIIWVGSENVRLENGVIRFGSKNVRRGREEGGKEVS